MSVMSLTARDRLARLVIIGVIFLAWEGLSRFGLVDQRLLPSAGAVLTSAYDLILSETFRAHLWVTLMEVVTAFVIAVPVGICLGLVIAESPYMSEVFKPLVFFIFSIPKSIFLPMFILAFGIGFGQKVAFGVFSSVFIMMMTAFAAMEAVRKEYVMVAKASGASFFQTVFRVYVPSMAPVLLEAVRLAMIFNFTGILLAEMYASRIGIGNQIGLWGQSYMLDKLLAGIMIVSVLAIGFNEFIRSLEIRLEHWRGD